MNGCLCSIPLQVADLARLNHENVGKLLGYCKESSPFTRMLVFEYASNGTLYEHLHCKSSSSFFYLLNQIHYFEDNCCVLADGEGCLSWTRRMNIILGMARGLKYLHSELQPPFTISELNSGAVYLTDDFSPKVLPEYKLLKYVPFYYTILQTISYNPDLNERFLGFNCSWLTLKAGRPFFQGQKRTQAPLETKSLNVFFQIRLNHVIST